MYYSQIQHHNHRFRHFLSLSISSLIAIAGGLVVLILATRYILSFIQINDLPSFTATIYSLSYPFVAPVTKVFSQVEVQNQTLIAIAFWAAVTWLLANLSTMADADA